MKKLLLCLVLVVLIIPSVYASGIKDDLQAGLWAYYDFNNNTKDMSGNAYHLNNSGGVYNITDRYGVADFALNFSLGYLNLGTIKHVPSTTEFSYCMWFNASTALESLFFVPDTDGASDRLNLYFSGGDLVFRYRNTSNQAGTVSVTVAAKSWNHTCAIYNGTDLQLYMDSNLSESVPFTDGYRLDHKIHVGANWPATGYYNGFIDGFGIWNRSLTSSEVDYLFKNYNFTFVNQPLRKSNVSLYDEYSNTLIEGETFTLSFKQSNGSTVYSATTNPYSFAPSTGYFDIEAYSPNYGERELLDYYINGGTLNLINLYLINKTIGSEIAFSVQDTDNNVLSDVNLSIYRFFNSASTLITQETSDFAGNIRLYLDVNYEYTMTFSKSGYDTKTINLEPSSADSPYTIYMEDISTIIPPIILTRKVGKLKDNVNLTYKNDTKNVKFEWYDIDNIADLMCLDVFDYNKSFFGNCSSDQSGQLNYTITTFNRTYTAKAFANIQGNSYVLKTIPISLIRVWERLGKDSIVVVLFMFLTLTFIGLANPIISIVLGVASLGVAYTMGILPVGLGTIMFLIFIVIIIIIGMVRRG